MNLILVRIVGVLFDVITLVIFVDVIGSWLLMLRLNLPHWAYDSLSAVRRVANVFLGPLRRVIPAIGGLDLTPLIALFLLDLLRRLIVGALLQ